MTTKRAATNIMLLLVLLWAILNILSEHPGIKRSTNTQNATAVNSEPNPAISVEPIDIIIHNKREVHTMLSARSARDLLPATSWRHVVVTWYDGQAGINGTGDGITATGTHVTAGRTIAVDPSVIPLGSTVEIQFETGAVHFYKAEDTGGAIKGSRIDIYDPSFTDCMRHGIQPAQYRIINKA